MARTPGLVVVASLVVLAGCLGTLGGTATETGTPLPDDASTPHPATAPTAEATVTDVVDGDTVRIQYANGTRDTVRLLGVDTPEVRGENAPEEYEGVPETAAGRECLRQAGETASDVARAQLTGQTVALGFDPEEGRRGYYDRLLAYVYVDGVQFNYRLIAGGHARVYESGFVERPRYTVAEDRAQADGRGLWRCSDPGSVTATPTPTPAADGPLSIAVNYDAEGNDNENLNDEYVILRNRADRRLNLSGWTVTDEAGKRYTLPEGTTLDPDESLTLHTGSGTDGDGHYYWGQTGAVWNNGGDVVTVRDATGEVVSTRSY